MKKPPVNQNKVLIIGCGIAGPALAMFLQKTNFKPVIYENRPRFQDDAGYFLNLSSNGLAVLNTLGVKSKVIEKGTSTDRIIFQNHKGKKLGENPEPSILIKRGLLNKVLREAALERGIDIKPGKKLTDVQIIDQHTVKGLFEDGSSAHGQILVGCDGIHSQTRHSIMPDAPQPEYLGVIDSGGFTSSASTGPADGIFRMTFGTDGFFGFQTTPSGETYWFENFAQKEALDHKLHAISNDKWRDKLINIHKHDHDPITEIIRSTKEKIGKWPNYEVPSLPAWHKGPVGLIGDAAHAMSPSAGQGASLALEDAIVLAKCLRDIPNAESAFSTFEQLRKDRVEQIARDARRNSDQKGPTNAITRKFRDWVLPFFLKRGVKSARQIYDYTVDWNQKVTEQKQTKKLNRRSFIIIAGSAVALLAGATVVPAFTYKHIEESTFVNKELNFKNELRIPPLAQPISKEGKTIFNLTLQKGKTVLFDGESTKTWGANGSYLMPTIRASKADDIKVRISNTLGAHTTIHWHGMHIPATMDGVHQIIEPGETWQPQWTIDQQAATLWYHPHLMGQTAEQVYRGLAGLFIIDDENSTSLALPDEYGVDDIPLIVQDRTFNDEGQFIYQPNENFLHGMGMFGDTILVNGTHAPYVDVPAKKVRLRILNASNARRYHFGFEDNRTFFQIATGGGLLEVPASRNRIILAPGERAEIIVDFSGEQTPSTLLSYAVIEEENVLQNFFEGVTGWDYGENEKFKIVEFRPYPASQADSFLPEKLAVIDRWYEDDAVKTRQFVLGTSTINGKKMSINRIDEVVHRGDIEIWEITNPSATYHPFHIHDVQFQILSRNDEPPALHERGWKDTVIVKQGEMVRLIMRFTDYANPNVPYMYHCHILEHEDMGMMGQFVVVDEHTPESAIEVKTEALRKEVTNHHLDH